MKQQNAQTTKDNTKKRDYENFPRKIMRNELMTKDKKSKSQNDFRQKDNVEEDNKTNNEKLYNLIININKKKILSYFYKTWSNFYNDKVYEYDGQKAFKSMKQIQNDQNLEIKHNDDEFNANEDLINNDNFEILDNKITKENKGKNSNISKINYNNVINKHLLDKASRYKNNVFKKKNKEDEKRVSLSNISKEINADKYNKKLINLLNIKRCQNDKLMLFFDKWFEKTYKNDYVYKRSNKRKKIKKKKYIDKKLILDDSSNTSNKEKSYENGSKYCKTGESVETRNRYRGRNYINSQLSYDSFPTKNNKRNDKDKQSVGKSEDESKVRRNSHNFKIKNIFNKLNTNNNNNNEDDKKRKDNKNESVVMLFKILNEHEKKNVYEIYKNVFKKMVNSHSKNNSSENIIKYRRKKGKYSAKLKLKKIINMISKTHNDNMIFTSFNKWRECKNIIKNNDTNKNENNKDIQKTNIENNINNTNNKESQPDIKNEKNIPNNENTSNIEKKIVNKTNPIEKPNINYNYEKTNILKEININKHNAITENIVEQKKKIYLHVVNANAIQNDVNKNKIKEERKNDNEKHEKHILGQISIKAQPPSQIINRGLPGQRKDNQTNNNNNNNKNKNNEYPLLKKEYYEDKSNVEKEMFKINNEFSDDDSENEKDSFEEELRKYEFKNLAINDFIGTMVKKGEINNNYYNIASQKYKGNSNNFKPDKQKIQPPKQVLAFKQKVQPPKQVLEFKQKVQPPRQVLEFNAKRNNFQSYNNNDIINNNENKKAFMNERDNKQNRIIHHQAKGRQIKRYYYRENDRKQKEENPTEKDKTFNSNKNNRIRYPYKRINHFNNKKKLTNLINKIDSLKNKNICFTKWKKYMNVQKVEPSLNDENIIDSINLDITNKNEKGNENGIFSVNSLENVEKISNILSFHSDISDNESKENKHKSYDKIKELTECNKKLLDKNLLFFNKENNFDFYLSLLIKNCKSLSANRIFCLYSLFREKNKLCIIRIMLNRWRQKSKCMNNEKENNNINTNDVNSNLVNKNLLLKNVVVKYKYMIENNPKKYYFKQWIKKNNI